MTKRRDLFDDSSLELLLDTITNAFGGILFLAILVVILLQGTSRKLTPREEVSSANPTELAGRLEQLRMEESTLKLELRAMDTIYANLATSDLRSTLTQLEATQQARDELAAERERLLVRIANEEGKLATIAEQDNTLTERMQSDTAAIRVVREELADERARRRINSPFPEERSATKRSHSATIRYGRWYSERLPDGRPNLDDFAVLDSDGKYLTITPKPYRGIPILQDGHLSSQIVGGLSSADPHRQYVDISIWDDSYDEFQVLRDYLVEHGFEYRLIVATEGDEVVETFVSDPKVQ